MADITTALIDVYLEGRGPYLDFGAGAGMLVRQMRERGYPFHGYDRYSSAAREQGYGRELTPDDRYEAITAFEVVEHLVDPVGTVLDLAGKTDHLLLSTELLPAHEPRPGSWWYYSLENGKHVGIFTRGALEALARRCGVHLYSDGYRIHLLARPRHRSNPARLVRSRLFRGLVRLVPAQIIGTVKNAL